MIRISILPALNMYISMKIWLKTVQITEYLLKLVFLLASSFCLVALGLAWWHRAVILALGRLRQENLNFKINLRLYSKTLPKIN
jgi:hypothetical protein